MSTHTPRKRLSAAATNTSSPSGNGDHSSRGSSIVKGATAKRRGSRNLWGTLLPLGIVFYFFWGWLESVKHHGYVFEPTKLHGLVRDSLAATSSLNSTDAIFDEILSRLNQDPKIARTLNKRSWKDENEWMFNNAGGAMGSMYIIHASITEYLIFFGTPIGTEGHTGRHTADDYFHILTGEQQAYAAGALTPEIYRPGSQHHLRRGYVKQYMMPETGCWALELAQGWIPPMLPFGLADTLFSTLDLPTFWRTAVITGREMIGNLLIGKF